MTRKNINPKDVSIEKESVTSTSQNTQRELEAKPAPETGASLEESQPKDGITIVSFGSTPKLQVGSFCRPERVEESRERVDTKRAKPGLLDRLLGTGPKTSQVNETQTDTFDTVADALQLVNHVLPWWILVAMKLFGTRIFKGLSSVTVTASGEVEITAVFRLFGFDFHVIIKGEVAYEDGIKIVSPNVVQDSKEHLLKSEHSEGLRPERAVLKMVDKSTQSILNARYHPSKHDRLIQDMAKLDRQVMEALLRSAAIHIKQRSDSNV